MTKMHMVAALNSAIMQEMERDKSVMCLGEDVGIDGGVFRVTDGLAAKFGKERVADTPLAEAAIVGTAMGLAVNGMKPIAEIQFIGFAYEAFHQINHHMARMRQRSEGTFPVPIVIRAPAGGGIKALELHSESPEAFFVHCHGIKVVMPSNPYDAKGLMISSIRDPDPVIFLEPERNYRSFKDEVPDEPYAIPLGDANIVKEGKDVSIITWGGMVRVAAEAAEKLKEQNIDAEIIDLRTIWPLDTDKIVQSVKKTGRAVVVYEAPKTGGFGAEIAARIQERAIMHMSSPVIRVASPDLPYPQFALEDFYLPNVKRIMRGVKDAMSY